MSHISHPEFDFWEFVSCGICHLTYINDSGALSNIPFWITECGHVACNAHINADRNCAECGSTDIHLLAMSRDLDPPMSNWFESAPTALDAVGYALRFQVNTMASLVRYYKKKYLQYRPLLERLKDEHAEAKRLRKLVDDLRSENQHLAQQLQSVGGASGDLPESRKRRRTDHEGRYIGQRSSSPRSVASLTTSIGPNRLTLPPSHHTPSFNSRQGHQNHMSRPQQNFVQYAYNPPSSAQGKMAPPMLSHLQSGSNRRDHARDDSNVPYEQQAMPPPSGSWISGTKGPGPIPATHTSRRAPSRQPSFLPPSTPQVSSGFSQRFTPATPSRAASNVQPAGRMFLPGPHHGSQSHTQRFVPSGTQHPAASGSVSGNAAASDPAAQFRSPSIASGGQRAPFVPGASGPS